MRKAERERKMGNRGVGRRRGDCMMGEKEKKEQKRGGKVKKK